MTEERLPLAELLEKAGEGDFLRAVAESVLQLLMETDVGFACSTELLIFMAAVNLRLTLIVAILVLTR